MNRLVLFLCLFFFGGCFVGKAQTKESILIKGRVLDSLQNEPLAAATVTVYQKSKDKILKYGFTNNRGAFSLSGIPLADSVFQIRIAHLGYPSFELDTQLLPDAREIDIGEVRIGSASKVIEAVEVNRPPVMMKNDTLEIHPEAFDLAPNAVVEDLLAKVPGIVIWADGMITVNGKKVDRVLVEGKPFFGSSGSNPTIATRNLPSEAIDKVKVYEERSLSKEADPAMVMDMMLKNKKKNGLFGKVSAGLGSKGHREGVFLLNYFDPKNQISLFGGENNINKMPRTGKEFQQAHVYKAGGENLNANEAELWRSGFNTFQVAGSDFARTWNEHVNSNFSFMHRRNNSEVTREMYERRLFENGRRQNVLEGQQSQNNELDQTYRGDVRYKGGKHDLRMTTAFTHRNTLRDQLEDRRVENEQGQLLSHQNKDIQNTWRDNAGKVKLDYKLQDSLFSEVRFSYELNVDKPEQERHEAILFSKEGEAPTSVDRLKNNRQQGNRHEIHTGIELREALGEMIKKSLSWEVNFENELLVNVREEDQDDLHFDPLTQDFSRINPSITYTDQWREWEWTPTIEIAKSKTKNLPSGTDNILFSMALGAETGARRNSSTHALRTLNQDFFRMLPSASIQYLRKRQLYTRSFHLGYETEIKQPQSFQLLSLIDTTQRDYNYEGNRELRPEEQYRFFFEYRNSSPIHSVYQIFRATYTLKHNQFLRNSVYTEDGGQVSSTVNGTGLPVLSLKYEHRIAPKLWDKPLSVWLISRFEDGRNYYFNNGTRYKNRHTRLNGRLQTDYVLHDWVSVGFLGSADLNWTRKSQWTQTSAGFDTKVTFPYSITLISRFSAVSNHYSQGLPGENRFIWNAHVYYRMLKKEQLEIKLSGYDILKNNKSIRSMLTDNIERQTTLNNIQQFFMIGLSYYPRFF